VCHAATSWYPVLRRGTDASVMIAMQESEMEECANDYLRVIRQASLALALSLAVLSWIRTISSKFSTSLEGDAMGSFGAFHLGFQPKLLSPW